MNINIKYFLNNKLFFGISVIVLLATSCSNGAKESNKETVTVTKELAKESNSEKKEKTKHQMPISKDLGKFTEKEGKRYLYGGENEADNFDITNYALKDEGFHFGIGRERFPALLKPEFISQTVANEIWPDSARFLLLHKGNETKAYAIKDLTKHEIVNDEINGEPVMAAYCVLADLGAVYDRTLAGKKYTFALSGYTYHDDAVWDGLDGFVLWDRETESLWWPLIGKAVSGSLQGAKMKVLDEKFWAQTTWKYIKDNYENVQVLKSGQDFDRPKEWPKYNNPVIEEKVLGENTIIAPKWGENEVDKTEE